MRKLIILPILLLCALASGQNIRNWQLELSETVNGTKANQMLITDTNGVRYFIAIDTFLANYIDSSDGLSGVDSITQISDTSIVVYNQIGPNDTVRFVFSSDGVGGVDSITQINDSTLVAHNNDGTTDTFTLRNLVIAGPPGPDTIVILDSTYVFTSSTDSFLVIFDTTIYINDSSGALVGQPTAVAWWDNNGDLSWDWPFFYYTDDPKTLYLVGSEPTGDALVIANTLQNGQLKHGRIAGVSRTGRSVGLIEYYAVNGNNIYTYYGQSTNEQARPTFHIWHNKEGSNSGANISMVLAQDYLQLVNYQNEALTSAVGFHSIAGIDTDGTITKLDPATIGGGLVDSVKSLTDTSFVVYNNGSDNDTIVIPSTTVDTLFYVLTTTDTVPVLLGDSLEFILGIGVDSAYYLPDSTQGFVIVNNDGRSDTFYFPVSSVGVDSIYALTDSVVHVANDGSVTVVDIGSMIGVDSIYGLNDSVMHVGNTGLTTFVDIGTIISSKVLEDSIWKSNDTIYHVSNLGNTTFVVDSSGGGGGGSDSSLYFGDGTVPTGTNATVTDTLTFDWSAAANSLFRIDVTGSGSDIDMNASDDIDIDAADDISITAGGGWTLIEAGTSNFWFYDDGDLQIQAQGQGANGSLWIGTVNRTVNTGGIGNTVLGNQSGSNSMLGDYNVFLGYRTGDGNTLDAFDYNVGIGYQAISAVAGATNVAIGYLAMGSSTSSLSIGIGANALQNATGTNNISLAGQRLTTGSNNISMGSSSLTYVDEDYNIAIGDESAGSLDPKSSGNVFMGRRSGQLYNGDNMTIIGTETDDYYVAADTLLIDSVYFGGAAGSDTIWTPAHGLTIGLRYFVQFDGADVPAGVGDQEGNIVIPATTIGVVPEDNVTDAGTGVNYMYPRQDMTNAIAIGYQVRPDTANQIKIGNSNASELVVNEYNFDINQTLDLDNHLGKLQYDDTTGQISVTTPVYANMWFRDSVEAIPTTGAGTYDVVTNAGGDLFANTHAIGAVIAGDSITVNAGVNTQWVIIGFSGSWSGNNTDDVKIGILVNGSPAGPVYPRGMGSNDFGIGGGEFHYQISAGDIIKLFIEEDGTSGNQTFESASVSVESL